MMTKTSTVLPTSKVDFVLLLFVVAAFFFIGPATFAVYLKPFLLPFCIALVYQTAETIQNVITYYAAHDNEIVEQFHRKLCRKNLL